MQLSDLFRGDATKSMPKLTGKTFFASSTSDKVKTKRKKMLTVYLKQLFTNIPTSVYTGAMDAFLTLTESVEGVISLQQEVAGDTSVRPVTGGRLANTSAPQLPVMYLPSRLPSELDIAALEAVERSRAATSGTGEGAAADETDGKAEEVSATAHARAPVLRACLTRCAAVRARLARQTEQLAQQLEQQLAQQERETERRPRSQRLDYASWMPRRTS